MSFPNCKPMGMGIVGLISPLQQLLFLWGFGYRQCSYCPGHWGFLLEGLQICSIIPYHHSCFLTSLPQLGVHVLHSEALQQRTILSSKGLYHDVNVFSHIGPPCLHWYDTRREGLYGLLTFMDKNATRDDSNSCVVLHLAPFFILTIFIFLVCSLPPLPWWQTEIKDC